MTRKQIAKIRRRVWNRRIYARRKEAAWLIRWWLIDIMGAHCALCGSVEALELDHYPKPRTWVVRDLNCYARAKHYLADWAAGNLRLLCCHCNKSDGGRKRWQKGHHEKAPPQITIFQKIAHSGSRFVGEPRKDAHGIAHQACVITLEGFPVAITEVRTAEFRYLREKA